MHYHSKWVGGPEVRLYDARACTCVYIKCASLSLCVHTVMVVYFYTLHTVTHGSGGFSSVPTCPENRWVCIPGWISSAHSERGPVNPTPDTRTPAHSSNRLVMLLLRCRQSSSLWYTLCSMEWGASTCLLRPGTRLPLSIAGARHRPPVLGQASHRQTVKAWATDSHTQQSKQAKAIQRLRICHTRYSS